MSLLLDALKQAEKAKQEKAAARRGEGGSSLELESRDESGGLSLESREQEGRGAPPSQEGAGRAEGSGAERRPDEREASGPRPAAAADKEQTSRMSGDELTLEREQGEEGITERDLHEFAKEISGPSSVDTGQLNLSDTGSLNAPVGEGHTLPSLKNVQDSLRDFYGEPGAGGGGGRPPSGERTREQPAAQGPAETQPSHRVAQNVFQAKQAPGSRGRWVKLSGALLLAVVLIGGVYYGWLYFTTTRPVGPPLPRRAPEVAQAPEARPAPAAAQPEAAAAGPDTTLRGSIERTVAEEEYRVATTPQPPAAAPAAADGQQSAQAAGTEPASEPAPQPAAQRVAQAQAPAQASEASSAPQSPEAGSEPRPQESGQPSRSAPEVQSEPLAPPAPEPPSKEGPDRTPPTQSEPLAPPAPEPARAARQPAPPDVSIARKPAVPDPIFPRLQRAYERYQQGEYAAAEKAYRAVLASDPRSRDALLGLAAVSTARGSLRDAYDLYMRVLAANPKDRVALAALTSMRGAANPQQSESRLKLLLDKEPGAPYLHFALGNLYADGSRWAQAQQAYFNAYRGDPGNGDYAFNLAVSLDHLGQPRAALDYYRRALELAAVQPVKFSRDAVAGRLATLSTRTGANAP